MRLSPHQSRMKTSRGRDGREKVPRRHLGRRHCTASDRKNQATYTAQEILGVFSERKRKKLIRIMIDNYLIFFLRTPGWKATRYGKPDRIRGVLSLDLHNVHILEPADHSTEMVRCLDNETAVIVKSPPRCRVNGMIKPNYIRWAVPQLASGNQCRFP